MDIIDKPCSIKDFIKHEVRFNYLFSGFYGNRHPKCIHY